MTLPTANRSRTLVNYGYGRVLLPVAVTPATTLPDGDALSRRAR
jgi:hypothetical protein